MLVMPVSWFLGTRSGVPMGTTMAIFWLSPLMILGAAMLFLGERVSPLAWAVSAIAAVGGAVADALPEVADAVQPLVGGHESPRPARPGVHCRPSASQP